MPYCSTGILPFMEIIKHQFKGTSTVLVSEKKKFYLCPDFSQVLTVLFIFCKAGCIENVTKDVPTNKLYTYSAYFETFLWKRGNRHFWHFPTIWTAVHRAATECHISKSWHSDQLYGAACCREEPMGLCSVPLSGMLAEVSCMYQTKVLIINVKLKLHVLWLGGILV